MKQILIYGDSYVYGKFPGGDRYPANKRFTGIVREKLGSDYHVIEEGLRGRMLFGENGFFPERDGFAQFGPIVGSHLPLDLIIFMLGANDCNSSNPLSEEEIASKYHLYNEKITFWCDFHKCHQPKVLILIPPIIDQDKAKAFGEIFTGATKRSERLQNELISNAEHLNWQYLQTSEIIKVSPIDGVHLDEVANQQLAEMLEKKIMEMIII